MFHKVHIRLTLLCAGITIFILVSMSFLYLCVSEDSLNRSEFLSFQRDMNSLVSTLKQQSVITNEWLARLEADGPYYISLTDNGIPLLFNKNSSYSAKAETLDEAMAYFEKVIRPASYIGSDTPFQAEFTFTTSLGRHFNACFASIPRKAGQIEFFVLSPLDRVDAQIREQQLRFFLINLAAVILLILFSWLFTRILLSPIEKSRKEQVQFIASASHELRTPLTVILSCVAACKKATPKEQDGFLDTILNEGQRMNRLISDMLTLSKTDNHTFDIHLEMMEADTLLLDLYESLKPMAKGKKITLGLTLPETIFPPCLCDEARLSQVVTILLHNALSYTPQNGHVMLLLVDDHPGKGQFTIQVADDGIGIPDSEKENIFKRFYRIESSRSAKEHSGLGLSIAAEIVLALGGSVSVKDTPGGGSTFAVVIPAPRPESSL